MASLSSIAGMSKTTSTYSSKGYGGLASGLNTDELIESFTIGTRTKIAKQKQQKQLLSWKMEAYQSISSKLIAFSEKFTSFSSKTNLNSAAFFDTRSIIAKGTNSQYVSVEGNSTMANSLKILSATQARNASATTEKIAANEIVTGDIDFSDAAIAKTKPEQLLAGQTITVAYGDEKIDVKFADAFNGTTKDSIESIKSVFNEAFKEKFGEGNELIKMELNGDKLELQHIGTTSEDSPVLSITKGTGQSLKALGFTAGVTAKEGNPLTASSAFDSAKLIQKRTISMTYNGTTKSVVIPDVTQFAGTTEEERAAAFTTALQGEIDKAFGSNRIQVKTDTAEAATQILTFSTVDDNSTLSVATGEGDMLGDTGFLKLKSGTSNRLSLGNTIGETKFYGRTGENLFKDGKATITINGTAIEIKDTDSIANVLGKINRSDAGVKVSYLETTNSFHIESTIEGGAGKTNITDINTEGSLANTLFGSLVSTTVGQDSILKFQYGSGAVQTLERATNVFNVDGLTVTVNGAFGNITSPSEADAVTFTSTPNTDAIVTAVKEMVDAYNEVIELVNKEVSTKKDKKDRDYVPLTEEQEAEMTEKQIEQWNEKAKTGILFNDTDLRSLASELRFSFSFGLDGVGDLSSIGLSTASAYKDNGKVVLDEDKLRQAIAEDPEKVKQMFIKPADSADSGDKYSGGIMSRVQSTIERYAKDTGSNKGILVNKAGIAGSISETNSTLYKSIKDIDDYVKILEKRLTTEQDRYQRQFTALEQLVAQMNSQSSWLTQSFGG